MSDVVRPRNRYTKNGYWQPPWSLGLAPRLNIWRTLVWVCPKKATDYRHSDRKDSASGYSNDPSHGSPCPCADGDFCRGIDAGHVPWRRQQSVADQGNKGV